ncbi:MAG: flagellin FliC [Acidobacteria bacterium]|nr:flagellin FliC [Acidobacteriota bacterium]MBI3472007.1 flagellin FliC [Candidatus Solibacter usitatus]
MYTVQTNISSIIAQENLRVNGEFQARTIQRLTSGYRINSSGDDAAGLAVANKYRSNIAELNQGVRNANDGISILQIIDGGLNNIAKILDRLKTLASESATDTFTGNRTTLNNEFTTLLTEITRQAANIKLNSGGTYNASIAVYIGGGNTQGNSQVTINLSGATNAVDITSLGINASVVDTKANALTALTALGTAVDNLGVAQGAVGTGQNDLQYAVQLAQAQVSAFSAAESRLRDADIAAEAANLTKAQTLQQASLAALAQANAAPQAVLALFR